MIIKMMLFSFFFLPLFIVVVGLMTQSCKQNQIEQAERKMTLSLLSRAS
jgi:hypothetical protein